MRTAALCLSAAFALGSPARGQGPTPPPPDLKGEPTQQKVDALTEGLTKLAALRAKLGQLGDPAKPRSDESDEEYLARVDQVLKGRALFIHQLHQQVQECLMARYELEAYVEEYIAWTASLSDRLKAAQKRNQEQAKALDAKTQEAEKDIIALAHLVYQDAPDEETRTWAAGLFSEAWLPQIKDLSAREAKVAGKTAKERADALKQIVLQYKTDRYEISYLTHVVLPETDDLRGILPEKHRKAIDLLQQTLRENKEALANLSFEAAQLSVMARYARQGLEWVRPDGVGDSNPNLLRLREREKAIKDAITSYKKLTGKSTELEAAVGTDVKQMFRSFKDSSLAPTPDPAKEKGKK